MAKLVFGDGLRPAQHGAHQPHQRELPEWSGTAPCWGRSRCMRGTTRRRWSRPSSSPVRCPRSRWPAPAPSSSPKRWRAWPSPSSCARGRRWSSAPSAARSPCSRGRLPSAPPSRAWCSTSPPLSPGAWAWPFRSGGGLCAAKTTDAQAAYESANTLQHAMLAGVNFMLHVAGWLEGGLVMGYEKFVMDADQAGMMQVFLGGVDLSVNAQAMDAIREVGPGSHFLGCAHTQANFETAFYRSTVADNNSFEQWEAGRRDGRRTTRQHGVEGHAGALRGTPCRPPVSTRRCRSSWRSAKRRCPTRATDAGCRGAAPPIVSWPRTRDPPAVSPWPRRGAAGGPFSTWPAVEAAGRPPSTTPVGGATPCRL